MHVFIHFNPDNDHIGLHVCLSVCYLQDLGEGTIMTLKTSINAKQIMLYSS